MIMMAGSSLALAQSSVSICNGSFAQLPVPDLPSRGCVVETQQVLEDEKIRQAYSADVVDRRYILYVPENLPKRPVPVVFAFHGQGVNAEAFALFNTRNSFERLADEHKFIVVYPNALPHTPGFGGPPPADGFGHPGAFQGCFSPHSKEGVDVLFTKQILRELKTAGLSIDRRRIYATGFSGGGGMAVLLAMEAPQLVAAIAVVAPLPFHKDPVWSLNCNLHPKIGTVPMAIVAGTADLVIPYNYTQVTDNFFYPGMEAFRDSWLEVMGLPSKPIISFDLPNTVSDDAYEPVAGISDSYLELEVYFKDFKTAPLLFYRAVGMGHDWPHPIPNHPSIWPTLGKNNQDIDFAEHAWQFFSWQRPRAKRSR